MHVFRYKICITYLHTLVLCEIFSLPIISTIQITLNYIYKKSSTTKYSFWALRLIVLVYATKYVYIYICKFINIHMQTHGNSQ